MVLERLDVAHFEDPTSHLAKPRHTAATANLKVLQLEKVRLPRVGQVLEKIVAL